MAGLAIDTLWFSDTGNRVIGKTSTAGIVRGVFDYDDYGTRDLAWDGTHVWAISLDGAITKFDTHGNALAVYSGLLSSGWGLTFDGMYIWASSPNEDKIYQLSFPGLGDFTAPPAPEISSDTHPSEHLWYSDNSPTFHLTEPSDPSGIAGYSYWLDHSPLTEPDTTSEGISTTVTFVDLADGTWHFHCRASDGAGNWGPANHKRIHIDTEPPAAPVAVEVVPDDWTNVNLFQITWSYPADSSSIAGSYYTFGLPPVHETDGTAIQTSLLITAAPAEGENIIYIWLEDGAGNRDHTANGSGLLRYDVTGPVSGTIFIDNGAEITGSSIVLLADLSASDEHSGLGYEARMRFSNDGIDWSPAESFAENRPNWDLSLYGGTSEPGEKTVFVQYRDAAGNWSAPFTDTILLAGPLAIDTESLPDGAAGFAYQETLAVSGGVPPFTWDLSNGQLPPDLILSDDGIIRGSLEEPGTWVFEVEVTDAYSNKSFRTFRISVYTGSVRGDVNGDTQMDLIDLMLAVGYILGREELTYPQIWAADVNGDGLINVVDLIAIAHLILGIEPGTAKLTTSPVNVSLSGGRGASEGVFEITFSLRNTTPVRGLQMRLGLPPRTVLVERPHLTERCRSFNLGHAERDGELVVIIYPSADVTIAPGSGPVVGLTVSGFDSPSSIDRSVIHEILVAGIDGRLLPVQTESEGIRSESVPTLRAYNYPNPFNPDTRINVSLQREEHITIAVYDVLGRKLRTLVEALMDEGAHTVEWDGRDHRGCALPSGVYYCRIEGQRLSRTIPLTLIR